MKTTNYFPHDHNARGDEKIINLRMIHGWKGYGLYWGIVEKLHESTNGELDKNYTVLAYDLREEESLIKSIIEEFALFNLNGETFTHHRVKENIEFRRSLSEAGRKGGLKNTGSQAKASLKPSQSKKERKKEINKVNKERKEKQSLSDEDFLKNLKTTYDWVAFDTEMRKIDGWLSTHPERRKTRQFIINWFNKTDKPLPQGVSGSPGWHEEGGKL